MKLRLITAGLSLALCSTLFLTSCGKDDDPDYNSGGNNNPPPATNTITMSNMRYSVGSLTVKAGATVTWVNDDEMSHTVTSDNGTFNSGNLKKGDTYKYTFNDIGTYPYHCGLHTEMKANIVVNY